MAARRKRKGTPDRAAIAAQAFAADERAIYRSLTTPEKIQRFLDEEIAYNKSDVDTCYSPRLVLRHRTGHCMEGALFAAAALRKLGYPPLVVDLEAERDDDHVIVVYKRFGCWGSMAKSNYSGIRSREPVYQSIRELAMSYFEHYFNPKGEKTLRAYSRPVNLARFDYLDWMNTEEEVWAVPEHLVTIPHVPLVSRETLRIVNRMDRRLYEAGKLGSM